MRTPRGIATALVALAISAPLAAQTIDQQQNTVGTFNGNNFAIGQSFQPTATTSAGAGVRLINLTANPVASTITISLWDAVPNASGANILASQSSVFTAPPFDVNQYDPNNLAAVTNWFDVFWNAVSVVPGSTYYLSFTSSNSSVIAAYNSNFNNDPYVNGRMYVNQSANPNAEYSPLNPWLDVAFREYSSDALEVTTPEPASVVLLATGLIGGLGVRRRLGMRTRPG